MKTSSSRSWTLAGAVALAVIAMLVPAATAGAAATGGAGALPSLPDGLNVAIGAHVTANSGAAPSTTLANIDDGDGTSRWCPSTVGIHQVTIDLGRVVDVSGTGATFSGEEGSDGSYYSVSTGMTAPAWTPFPDQAAGDRNTIVQGRCICSPASRLIARRPCPPST